MLLPTLGQSLFSPFCLPPNPDTPPQQLSLQNVGTIDLHETSAATQLKSHTNLSTLCSGPITKSEGLMFSMFVLSRNKENLKLNFP